MEDSIRQKINSIMESTFPVAVLTFTQVKVSTSHVASHNLGHLWDHWFIIQDNTVAKPGIKSCPFCDRNPAKWKLFKHRVDPSSSHFPENGDPTDATLQTSKKSKVISKPLKFPYVPLIHTPLLNCWTDCFYYHEKHQATQEGRLAYVILC